MSAPSPQIEADIGAAGRAQIEFEDNLLLPALYGERDQHLDRIERQLGVSLIPRGNRLSIAGPASATEVARLVLTRLYDRLKRDQDIDTASVDAAIRLAQAEIEDKSLPLWRDDTGFRTRKRRIAPRSAAQAHYVKAMREHELVFGLGPAGTGKTYLAVAAAVDLLMAGKVERIILSRPAVEAGERLGFLPGDLREKVDPYLRPIFDALNDMMPADQLAKRLASGEIEVAPIAFMRGRTLSHAFVILDEAQNTTPVQMKMFLTRLGENSRMVVTGDPTQIDLPSGTRSGLADALEALRGVEEVGIVRFTEKDVVRHRLVARIVGAYEARDRALRGDEEQG
jgi:phosphate starvation-inducible protein PhoH and related proteins